MLKFIKKVKIKKIIKLYQSKLYLKTFLFCKYINKFSYLLITATTVHLSINLKGVLRHSNSYFYFLKTKDFYKKFKQMISMKNMLKKNIKMINLHQLKKIYKFKALKSFNFREYINKLSDLLITATSFSSPFSKTKNLLFKKKCSIQSYIQKDIKT